MERKKWKREMKCERRDSKYGGRKRGTGKSKLMKFEHR